ncbi:hypothetical protein ACFO3A_10390 [Comamonas nitrativorans]|uniref:Uncharacterized protein n=1 Tax=Comamonas nitrativorans TaxID=108437 RepID=A0ABV9H0A4_9BURK
MAIGAASGFPCHTRAGRATTNNVPIDAPSMKGDSGSGGAGAERTPAEKQALTLGVGVQGYFGQKEGVTGTLQAGYKF